MKGFILLHVCMRKSSSLLWFSNANAGGSLWKLYDSNTALGLFVVKKEKEKNPLCTILHFTQEENGPLCNDGIRTVCHI